MRHLLVSFLTISALAACGGKPDDVQHPADTASSTSIELGEITVFDGDQAVIKIHADGKTELAGHSGSMTLQAGQPASTDSLPIVWTPGPTFKADGTIEADGQPRARVVDGKIVDLASNKTAPITLAADSVTITDGGKSMSISIGADGKLALAGASGEAAAKAPRVEGADTPGKRRTVLLLLAMTMATEAPTVTPPAASETPAAAPAPAAN